MTGRWISFVAVASLIVLGGAAWRLNQPASRLATVPAAVSTTASTEPVTAAGASTPIASAAGSSAAQPAPPAAGATASNSSAAARGPLPVEVMQVSLSRVQDDVQAVGSLRSNEAVVLRSEVAGRVASIGFRDGQHVRRGQVLVALDASVNEAEVAQARAELDLGISNLKRTEDLAQRNFVSTSAQEQAASNAQVLQAKLRLAQARLDKTRILAPFDGVVGIRAFSMGDYVKEGTDLVNVEDVSRLKADFRLPERALSSLKVGQAVEVTPDALPELRARGVVEAINPRIDSVGRSVEVRAILPNADGRLRPGMFVRVKVVVGERLEAVVVPEEAVVPAGNEFFVYKVVDSMAMRVRVTPGQRRDGKVEIGSGLAAGDAVVVTGQMRLSGDAVPVRVVLQGAAQPKP